MDETIVIMKKNATPDQFEAVVQAVTAAGGRVIQRCPPSVLICQIGKPETLAGVEGIARVEQGPVEPANRLGLDEAGQLVVNAWNVRQGAKFRKAKALRADEGKPWDFHKARPDGDVHPVEEQKAPFLGAAPSAKAAPSNTSRYLTGAVAVGIVIVDGPANTAAAFTAAERANVVAEVQEGFTNLVNLAPAGANLNFILDVHTVTLTQDPATVSGEADWAGPAMVALGYAAGSSGMYDYLHDLRTTRWPAMSEGPDWAYIAFFTKYAAWWFAYASIGGPRLVMQYDNDGWGPAQIDRVFAHETGHIFNAADEYAASNCNTGGSWGYLGVANGNCAVNNPASIDCLMKGNTYNVCSFTLGHLGWRDSDGDGVPDPIDVTAGGYMTDVGIAASGPFYANGNLWIRNQDDGEANQSHQNPRSNLDNFIYARVKNFGGLTAEIVRVKFYLANYTGSEFVFPNDYANLIKAPDTPYPTLFAVSPGATGIAKVRLQPAQIPPTTWHPCLLVHVTSPQEAPVPSGVHVWDSNNLAQKNLVVDYVAPSQTLTLPIMLQNTSAEPAVFEVKRIRVPKTVTVDLQFKEGRLRPEILVPRLSQAEIRPLAPVPAATPVAVGAAGESGQETVLLQFLSAADVAVRVPDRPQELLFHFAQGSAFGMHLPEEAADYAEPASAGIQERWKRIFLPVDRKVTRFRLPTKGPFRKLAGISFTAPRDAQFGDLYVFELVQRNAQEKITGGIRFEIRVAAPRLVLEEQRWRVRVLRELGLATGATRFQDLAASTEALAASYLAPLGGRSADAGKTRAEFAGLLSEALSPRLWGHPVGALSEAARLAQAAPGLPSDLNLIGGLLYHAQENLLTQYET